MERWIKMALCALLIGTLFAGAATACEVGHKKHAFVGDRNNYPGGPCSVPDLVTCPGDTLRNIQPGEDGIFHISHEDKTTWIILEAADGNPWIDEDYSAVDPWFAGAKAWLDKEV